MADQLIERGGVPVLRCDPDGPPIAGAQDALDVIGAAYAGAEVVVLPVSRLDPRFFELSTGVAGEIMQKFVNYRVRLAIEGDISTYARSSAAFRDLVTESNRGRQIWFIRDLDELDAHLSGPGVAVGHP
jgi:hypothetical protein